MSFNGTILTTKGLALQAKVQSGTQLSFTKVKIGDGQLGSGQSLEALADLISPQKTLGISAVAVIGDGTSRVRAVVTNTDLVAGFFVREIGVFATDPDDGEILYCVANAGNECDYLPTPTSVAVEQTLDILMAIGNATNVTAVINETIVLATVADITDHNNNPDAHDLRTKLFMYRNKIINGDMLIDQRNSGVAQTLTAAAAIAYTVDRFYASCAGANITGQQIAGTGAYSKSYRFTGAAGNTGVLFGQRIEAKNCRDLLNKPMTGQVELSSSSLTSVTWSAYYPNTSDTFTAKTQIVTGTITINATPTIYNFSFNAGANVLKGLAIEFTAGALLAGKTLDISGVQLEKGVVMTQFETLPYSAQLGLCQRYYEVVGSGMAIGSVYVTTGGANDYMCMNGVAFKATKRAVPTISLVFSPYLAGGCGAQYPAVAADMNSTTFSAIAQSNPSVNGIGRMQFSAWTQAGTAKVKGAQYGVLDDFIAVNAEL